MTATATRTDLEVLKKEECRACNRPGDGRCKASPARDFIVCFRCSDEQVTGLRRIKQNGVCSTFVLTGSAADLNGKPHTMAAAPRPPATPKQDLDAIMARYRDALHDDEATRHAEARGVTAQAIRAYGCGSNAGLLCWPEYVIADGRARVAAIVTLGADNMKRAGKGHTRGISTPVDLLESAYPTLAVEGMGDCLACYDMGILALGRPNNVCGGTILAELLADPEIDFLIVADADEAGRTGAERLSHELAERLGREVRYSIPPPPHKDARAFLIAMKEKEVDPRVAGELFVEHLLENAITVAPASQIAVTQADDVPDWQPFPLDCLTPKIRNHVTRAAAALGIDPGMLAVPVLVTLASVIGNSRRLVIKKGWSVPAILWTCIVGDSGVAKTPAIEFAARTLWRLYNQALKDFEAANQQFNANLCKWKDEPDETRGAKPQEPTIARILVSDVTIEALCTLLAENPRGLGLICDELAGWFGSHDQYKGKGKGADLQNWLQIHSGQPLVVDRKGGSGSPRLRIYIRRSCVSITGGVQLSTLQRTMSQVHFETGFVARILFCMPPERLRQWTDGEISQEDEAEFDAIIDQLYSLEPDYSDGELGPKFIGMGMKAKALYTRHYNEHWKETHKLHGDLKAAFSKREGYVGRLALVLHLARWAAGEGVNPDQVDEVSVENAIRLVQWFSNEDKRVYAALSQGFASKEHQELLTLLKSKGGRAAPRDLQRWRSRLYVNAEEAELALNRLHREGHGSWVNERHESGRGAPRRVFVLGNCVTANRHNSTPATASETRFEEGGK